MHYQYKYIDVNPDIAAIIHTICIISPAIANVINGVNKVVSNAITKQLINIKKQILAIFFLFMFIILLFV